MARLAARHAEIVATDADTGALDAAAAAAVVVVATVACVLL